MQLPIENVAETGHQEHNHGPFKRWTPAYEEDIPEEKGGSGQPSCPSVPYETHQEGEEEI